MLNEHDIEHTYRETTRDPLTIDELRELFTKLQLRPRVVLRARDANKAGIPSDMTDDVLLEHMASNPKLLQRPIGILGDKAVVGRPPENLLTLLHAR